MASSGGNHPHQRPRQKRPSQRQNHRRQTRPPALFPQPVDPLKDHHQNRERSHHAVHGVKAVGPHGNHTAYGQKQQPGHQQVNGVHFRKILLSVVGMCKPFRETEQKQRRGQSPQHTEPFRNPPRESEDVMNVIQNHQQKRRPFQRRAAQSPGFSELFFCWHDTLSFPLFVLFNWYNNIIIHSSQKVKQKKAVPDETSGTA